MTSRFIIALALGSVALPALAQSADPAIDTDGDGFYSYEELKAVVPILTDMDFEFESNDFTDIDGSGDGLIDMNEMAIAVAEGRWPAIDTAATETVVTAPVIQSVMIQTTIDTDGDGFYNYTELQAVVPILTDTDFEFESTDFTDIDGSGDGLIDMNEMAIAVAEGRFPAVDTMLTAMPAKDITSSHGIVDTDGDGSYSYPEMQAGLQTMTDPDFDFKSSDFGDIDSSGDGFVDMNEMAVAVATGRWPSI